MQWRTDSEARTGQVLTRRLRPLKTGVQKASADWRLRPLKTVVQKASADWSSNLENAPSLAGSSKVSITEDT